MNFPILSTLCKWNICPFVSGIFHLACHRLSMLQHVINFISLRLNNIPLLHMPHFIHLSVVSTSRLLCCEHEHTTIYPFESVCFSFFWKYTWGTTHVSHHSYTIWHSHQQYTKVPISPHSCQHLFSLLIMAILKKHLMVLICISLMTNGWVSFPSTVCKSVSQRPLMYQSARFFENC